MAKVVLPRRACPHHKALHNSLGGFGHRGFLRMING